MNAQVPRTVPPHNSCRIVQGRLMEIQVTAGYNVPGDVDLMMGLIRRTLASVPGSQPVVIAADWRACHLFTPAVSERVIDMLTRDNRRIERSAILHRDNQATSVLQVMRLIRESGHAHRRVFTSPVLMRRFLDEMLNRAERTRLKQFIEQVA